jgi:DNA-binding transcriptional LysR family regulator
MDPLTDMQVFTQVVAQGGFSAAAREMNLSPAVVSKRIARLEEHLGVRLLNRTTRHLSLTEAGENFYRRAERIVADVSEAFEAVSESVPTPKGHLRVVLPASFGRLHVMPAMREFLDLYPDISASLIFTDNRVDIVEQGIDVAIRIADLEDSSLIARKLAPNRRVVVASPDFVERFGEPSSPRDLLNFNCVAASYLNDWVFNGPDGSETVHVSGRLECNDGDALRTSAITGVGIALKSTWDVGPDIAAGRLLPLLTGWEVSPGVSINAVYPSRRFLSAKVRVFVDFFAARFGPEPYWDRGFEARRVV